MESRREPFSQMQAMSRGLQPPMLPPFVIASTQGVCSGWKLVRGYGGTCTESSDWLGKHTAQLGMDPWAAAKPAQAREMSTAFILTIRSEICAAIGRGRVL